MSSVSSVVSGGGLLYLSLLGLGACAGRADGAATSGTAGAAAGGAGGLANGGFAVGSAPAGSGSGGVAGTAVVAIPDLDAGSGCPESIAEYACNSSNVFFECRPTWAEVLSNPADCVMGNLNSVVEKRADCGAYHVRVLVSTDTAVVYYYDAASGALVAAYDTGASGGARSYCLAGPADGISGLCGPLAHFALSDACFADAGIDSGA